MINDWSLVTKVTSPYTLQGGEPFARMLSRFDRSKLTACFEIDGKIFLLDPNMIDDWDLIGPDEITVAQAIKRLKLKPIKSISSSDLSTLRILDGLPRSRRMAVIHDGSRFEVWKRIRNGDRRAGSVSSVGAPVVGSPMTKKQERPLIGGSGSWEPAVGGGGLPDFGLIDIREEPVRSPAPSHDDVPFHFPHPETAPAESTHLDEDVPDAGAEPAEDLLGEAAIGNHPAVALPVEPEGGRWINAVLKNHDVSKPLEVDWSYNLAISIDVDPEAGPGKLASAEADPSLRSGPTDYWLVVEISVDDKAAWELSADRQKLRVGKNGLSIGEAVFQITPLQSGARTLTAIIHRDNNLIQKLEISVDVGVASVTGTKVTALRKQLAFPARGIKRDVSMIIEPKDARYAFQAWGDAVSKFDIRITGPQLENLVNNARDALLGIVKLVDPSPADPTQKFPFQSLISIPQAVEKESLVRLAKAGQRLFYQLFYHTGASSQCREFGDWLISEADKGNHIFLQINAELFPVPWAMLYPTKSHDAENVSWERFLGMRCVIEQTPLRNVGFACEPVIQEGASGIAVSLNLNHDIEGTKGYISRQRTYWNSIATMDPKIRLVERSSRKDILDALAEAGNDDQIIYLYCHADAVSLGAGTGPGDSSFTFTNSESITLYDLDEFAPATTQFIGSPLVFINACESGTLSPVFYGGFISYFVSKGARGVIGTECKVPALFAEEWSKQFFSRFLTGEELGVVMLKMRQKFVNEYGNGLGLLYGLHCNADTQVARIAA